MACPNNHPIAIDETSSRASFSFNAPFGVLSQVHRHRHRSSRSTPSCSCPDDDLSTSDDGAIAARGPPGSGSAEYFQRVHGGARRATEKFSIDTRPGSQLPDRAKEALLHGSEDYKVHVKLPQQATAATGPTTTGFEGVVPFDPSAGTRETDSDWSA